MSSRSKGEFKKSWSSLTMSNVEVLLTVGKLDASLALLTTDDHHVIEFPTVLLPDDVKAGSIVKLSVSQNLDEEKRQRELFREIQNKILEKYGTHKPKEPVLKIVNVTQTSCVLAWDPLYLGSAKLKSLILYRQGVRSTVIPCPLKGTTTKISGLSVDTAYEFQLKLSTTSGQYWSEKVKMHTHKMTDMSGITVCLGQLDPLQNISADQVAQSLMEIGARPLQRHVAIDTTHFVTNDPENDEDPELIKAKNSNIPIVRPEWVRASEMEKRIVGVRGFYLDADPGILKSYQFPPVKKNSESRFNEHNRSTNGEIPIVDEHENKNLEPSAINDPESFIESEEVVPMSDAQPSEYEEGAAQTEDASIEALNEIEVDQTSIEQTETFVDDETNAESNERGLESITSILEESRTNIEAEDEEEAVPGVETEAVPEGETETVLGVETEAVPEVETEAVPEGETETVLGFETEAVPEVETEAVPEGETETVLGVETEAVPEGETETVLGVETEAEPEVKTERVLEVEEATVPEVEKVEALPVVESPEIEVETVRAHNQTQKSVTSQLEVHAERLDDAELPVSTENGQDSAHNGIQIDKLGESQDDDHTNKDGSDELDEGEEVENDNGSEDDPPTTENTNNNSAGSKSKKKKNKKKKNKKK